MAVETGASNNLPQWPNLAAIRRSKGISLENISEHTKISKRFLRAVEDGDFAQLPGGVFNTSYIRQYAKEIDFDESDLVRCYNARTGARPSVETAAESARKKKPVSRAVRFLALARF